LKWAKGCLSKVLNLMNMDNVVGWHVVMLPLIVAIFLGLHLMWVRRHGIVPPLPAEGTGFEGEPEAAGPGKHEASSSPHAGMEEQR